MDRNGRDLLPVRTGHVPESETDETHNCQDKKDVLLECNLANFGHKVKCYNAIYNENRECGLLLNSR